ncbi:diguanylate cyclase domain-containing protein [Deinococcus aquaedulcis]|uniref:diguanylate cyclase domain-containing protein n=1 Tax=Deinococcus aquaedulcis TaxID=2840455 RepID=UPI001C83789C|nr:diguanylate cyclase [Deinococcus aquaedulcis]
MTSFGGGRADPAPPEAHAALLAQLAAAESALDTDPARSQALATGALAQAEALDADPVLLARALCTAAAPALFQNRYAEAQALYRRVLALEVPDASLVCRALSGLGACALRQGDYARALELFLEGLRRVPPADTFGRLRLLNNVGLVHTELGDHALALQAHEQVVALAEELGDDTHLLTGVSNIVIDRYALGEYARTLALIAAQEESARQAGLRHHALVFATYRVLCLLHLGRVDDAQGAAQALAPAVTQAEGAADWDTAAHALTVLGQVALAAGHPEDAQAPLNAALTHARHWGLRARECEALRLLSEAHRQREDWRAAYETLAAHHALERALHAEHLDRRARALRDQVQLERLRREAETQRQQLRALLEDHNTLLQDRHVLVQQASHDPLTGLLNRAQFRARAEALLAQPGQAECAVVFLDLDGFKPVNDTHGHAAGDDLLVQVAGRLRGGLRGADLVARLGGDEFAVFLTRLRHPGDAQLVATKLLDTLSRPYTLPRTGATVHVSASVGVAVTPQAGPDLGTLQRCADEAMYAAKRQGRRQVCLYVPAEGTPAP